MLEQISNDLVFVAAYTNGGLGATGLTVTVDVYRGASEIVTGASTSEIGDGLYSYTLSSASVTTEGLYVAVFKTAGTVDQAHIYSSWAVSKAGIEYLDAAMSTRAPASTALSTAQWTNTRAGNLDNLDAQVSTRLASASYTAPPSATDIATAVWNSVTRTLTAFGFNVTVGTNNDKAGYSLTATPPTDSEIAEAVWESASRTLTAFGFSVTVGTNNDKTGYSLSVTPPTAAAITTAVWAAASRTLTAFGFSVTVGTNSDKTGYTLTVTPPTDEEIAGAVWEYSTRELTAGGGGGGATAEEIADAVWDEAVAEHQTSGTTGKALTSASAAGDPLTGLVPGSYEPGTAGYAIGKIGTGDGYITAPVLPNGDMEIVQGNDYKNADGTAIQFTDSGWPTLTSASVKLRINTDADNSRKRLEVTGMVVTPTGTNKRVRFDLTAIQTGLLNDGAWPFEVEATLSSGSKTTLVLGTCVVLKKVTI